MKNLKENKGVTLILLIVIIIVLLILANVTIELTINKDFINDTRNVINEYNEVENSNISEINNVIDAMPQVQTSNY